jgi:dihydrofolate reductase
MRKVILVSNVTLDGAIAGPAGELDWMLMDHQLNVEFTERLRAEVDTMIAGRRAYHHLNEAFSAQATHPDSPPELVDFATWMVETPKLVFSRTLTTLLSPKDRLATEDIPAEIKAVKETEGKGLVLFGGVQTAQQFVRHNVVDEYWLKVYPVALGNGQPLFTDLPHRAGLKLTESKAYDSGILTLRYVPA